MAAILALLLIALTPVLVGLSRPVILTSNRDQTLFELLAKHHIQPARVKSVSLGVPANSIWSDRAPASRYAQARMEAKWTTAVAEEACRALPVQAGESILVERGSQSGTEAEQMQINDIWTYKGEVDRSSFHLLTKNEVCWILGVPESKLPNIEQLLTSEWSEQPPDHRDWNCRLRVADAQRWIHEVAEALRQSPKSGWERPKVLPSGRIMISEQLPQDDNESPYRYVALSESEDNRVVVVNYHIDHS